MIILECDHQLTDPSNGTQVQAEIDAGRATLIKNVKVGHGAPSATSVASNIANTPDKVVKYSYEISVIDGNVNNANMSFYNTLGSGASFGGLILHNSEDNTVLYYDKEFRAQGGLVAPDNDGEFVRYEYSLMMDSARASVNPELATEPSGIFDT